LVDRLPARRARADQSHCTAIHSGFRRPRQLGSRLSGCGAGLRVLPGTSTRALARDNHTALEDLAAPHTPRLLAFERCVEALTPDRAVGAQLLCAFEVRG